VLVPVRAQQERLLQAVSSISAILHFEQTASPPAL
jgi:hypothetical protein